MYFLASKTSSSRVKRNLGKTDHFISNELIIPKEIIVGTDMYVCPFSLVKQI
jgi:hypothetical protein